MVTQRPLHLRGERQYAVGRSRWMWKPSPRHDRFRRSPAVRLFVERVRDVQPDFRLTSANGPIVTAICRRLDALPLALELAAPWIKVLSVEDLLRRLTDDVLLSTVGPRDLPDRRRVSAGTGYQLLAASEQRVTVSAPGRFPIRPPRRSLPVVRIPPPGSTTRSARRPS
jgi:predicted ATPase